MVSHCANPNCQKPLHYLREGKVFLFTRKNPSKQDSKGFQRLEHYWLCGDCARDWTLTMDGEHGMQLVAKKRRRFRTAYRHPSAAPAL
jgi:hypothetical protein